MDLNPLLQIKFKKSLWADVVFYSAVSLLLAAVLCYFIFAGKINLQKNKIKELEKKIQEVGSEQQKQYEQEIFTEQKKLKDFSMLTADHKISLNVFTFIEQLTLPNVWFNRFDMVEKGNEISLSGETENMEVLSQQISIFEKSDYIEKITLLDFNLGTSGKTGFNLKISLSPKVFTPAFAPPNPKLTGSLPNPVNLTNSSNP